MTLEKIKIRDFLHFLLLICSDQNDGIRQIAEMRVQRSIHNHSYVQANKRENNDKLNDKLCVPWVIGQWPFYTIGGMAIEVAVGR